jgi:hypothetical protein
MNGDRETLEKVLGSDIPEITLPEVQTRPGEYISYGLDYLPPELNFDCTVQDFL